MLTSLRLSFNGVVISVETYHPRLAQTRPIRRLHNCPVHGTASTCCTQTFPQHVTLHVRGQVRGSKFCFCLPDTLFTSRCLKEEKQRKLLRVRLDMAKFLQETLRESGLKANAHIVGTDAFKEFFRKVGVVP